MNLLIIGNFRVTVGGEDIGSKSYIIKGPEKGLLKIRIMRPSLAKENRILEKYHLQILHQTQESLAWKGRIIDFIAKLTQILVNPKENYWGKRGRRWNLSPVNEKSALMIVPGNGAYIFTRQGGEIYCWHRIIVPFSSPANLQSSKLSVTIPVSTLDGVR